MEAEDARRFVKDCAWARRFVRGTDCVHDFTYAPCVPAGNADYVKEDSCHGVPPDPPGSPPGTAAIEQYRNMSRALNATGKHVVLDACWYTCYPASKCPGTTPLQMDKRVKVANSWRVGMVSPV